MGFTELVKSNPKKFKMFFGIYNYLLGGNRILKRGCSLQIKSALLKRCRIDVSGQSNCIEIGDLTRMNGTSIYVNGNNNKVFIDSQNGFDNCSIWIEDDNNEIYIGKHNRFFKNSHMAALEGTRIIIGEDGLFAPDVQIRTSDSHSILDGEGKRVNPAEDIVVGNHVWIATGSVVLKGSEILDNSVIGIKSLVNKKLDEAGCVYAGSPVKKVKTGITWDSKRL